MRKITRILGSLSMAAVLSVSSCKKEDVKPTAIAATKPTADTASSKPSTGTTTPSTGTTKPSTGTTTPSTGTTKPSTGTTTPSTGTTKPST
ncbi:MAG: hypothetical protein ACJ75J_05795, partial [Cytophagaceae bacterium]